MSALAAWVLSLMLALEPHSPYAATFSATATAIAHVVASEQPLFDGADGRVRTAALLVSLGWFESRFDQHAVGDHGGAHGLFQVHGHGELERELTALRQQSSAPSSDEHTCDAEGCDRRGRFVFRYCQDHHHPAEFLRLCVSCETRGRATWCRDCIIADYQAAHPHCRTCNVVDGESAPSSVAAVPEVERLRHQRDVARACVNTDMTHLASALVNVVRLARGYSWIAAGESGSHTYEEDERKWLREEIGWALDSIIEAATNALRVSGNIADVAFEGPLFPRPHPTPAPSADAEKTIAELRQALRSRNEASAELARKHERRAHELYDAVRAKQEAESLLNQALAAGLAECERLRAVREASVAGFDAAMRAAVGNAQRIAEVKESDLRNELDRTKANLRDVVDRLAAAESAARASAFDEVGDICAAVELEEPAEWKPGALEVLRRVARARVGAAAKETKTEVAQCPAQVPSTAGEPPSPAGRPGDASAATPPQAARATAVCQYRDGREDGSWAPEICGKPAKWLACSPYMNMPACDGHRCRCRVPVDETVAEQVAADSRAPAPAVEARAVEYDPRDGTLTALNAVVFKVDAGYCHPEGTANSLDRLIRSRLAAERARARAEAWNAVRGLIGEPLHAEAEKRIRALGAGKEEGRG